MGLQQVREDIDETTAAADVVDDLVEQFDGLQKRVDDYQTALQKLDERTRESNRKFEKIDERTRR